MLSRDGYRPIVLDTIILPSSIAFAKSEEILIKLSSELFRILSKTIITIYLVIKNNNITKLYLSYSLETIYVPILYKNILNNYPKNSGEPLKLPSLCMYLNKIIISKLY